MKTSNLGKIPVAVVVLLLSAQSQCFAQLYGNAAESRDQSSKQNLGDAFDKKHFYNAGAVNEQTQFGTAPILQGATCGTIGPQGGDATSIMGVNTASISRRPADTFPIVPTFLFSMLSLSLLIFGLRSLLVQKRAPLWVVGSIAAGALLIAGFIWATFAQPANYSTFGYAGLAKFGEPLF